MTTREAAVEYGVSEATIRRMVKASELEAEVLPRRGGQTAFRVRKPRHPASEPDQSESPIEPEDDVTPRQDVSAIIQAATAPLLELTRGQAETIAALNEVRSEWREKAAAANARAEMLQAERDALRAELDALRAIAERPWYRRWW